MGTHRDTPATGPVASHRPGRGPEELHERDRLPWPLAIRIAATIAGATWLMTYALINPPAPAWILPLFVFLSLRLVADLITALPGRNLLALTTAAVFAAVSWAYIPLGLHWFITSVPVPHIEPWLGGLMLLVGGLALAAQHERLRTTRAKTASWLGLIGLLIAAPGLALATTALTLGEPWNILLPVLMGTTALLLAIFMRPRSDTPEPTMHADWHSWSRAHRFRFTLIALIVAAYLLLRHTLTDMVLFLPLWEFAAAITLTGFLLWSLRTHLKNALLDDPVTSPHQRHETTVDRQSETQLDDWEHAFGEFFDHGDNTRLAQLAVRLEREDHVPARRAFAGVLSHRPLHGILLLHPLWGYLAATLTLFALAIALTHYGGHLEDVVPNAENLLPLSALAIGLWVLQFNRHGGPWWIKSLVAYAGLSLLPMMEIATAGTPIPGPLTLLAAPLGIPIGLLLLLQPLMHAWTRRTGGPPRYSYQGNDPAGALEELIRITERTLLVRAAWAVGGGILVFIGVAELARLAPEIAILFPLYLLGAIVLLIHPLVTALGLRVDHRRIIRLSERETSVRLATVQTALTRLREHYDAAPRDGDRDPHPRPGAKPQPRTPSAR